MEETDSKEIENVKAESMNVLIIWDFDWSLVNENTDYFPVFELLGSEEYARLQPEWSKRRTEEGMSFVEYQDSVVWKHLFADGRVSKGAFEETLAKLPVFDENLHVVRTLSQHRQCEQYIVSGANTVLVGTVLKAQGLQGLFPQSKVFTNYAWWEQQSETQATADTADKSMSVLSSVTEENEESSRGSDRMRVRGYIPKGIDHTCGICRDPYMCKGRIVRGIRAKESRVYQRVVYIGDGHNDFCPTLTALGDNDFVMCRKGKDLESLINGDAAKGKKVSANVRFWSDGKDLLSFFREALPFVSF